MALVDVDSWSTEYESCKHLSQMLSSQLQQRDNRQPLSTEFTRLTNLLKVGLKQFETELSQLEGKLNSPLSVQNISENELDERTKQVSLLQTELKYLRVKFNYTAKDELFEKAASPSTGRIADAPIIDTSDVNILKQRQIDLLEQQNQGLDLLSNTISRQRSLATQLGQEVEDQHEILDNLADTMERVESRVTVETSNISQINQRDSTWGYWLIIILLFVGIIITVLL